MRMTATVDQVMACVSCNRWDKAKIKAMFGQRKRITLQDLLADKRVKWYDKTWVAYRVFLRAYPYRFLQASELSPYAKSLDPNHRKFVEVSLNTRRAIYRLIRRKAREAGIM